MTNPKTNKSPLLKATGLWRRRKPDGSEFYSGSLGSLRVLIFPNTFAAGDRDPEFILYLAPNEIGREPSKPGGGGREWLEPGEEAPDSSSVSGGDAQGKR